MCSTSCYETQTAQRRCGFDDCHYFYNTYYNIISGVIDHVPVDDNPAYITMKRITLNKNTAYETVTMRGCHYETVNTSHYENV